MPEGSGPETAPRRPGLIRNPQDFYGGLALLAIALFAWWAGSDLPGMRGIAFGPGTAPRLFALLLGLLGAAVTISSLFSVGGPIEREATRGIVASVALILIFFVAVNLFTRMPELERLSFPLAGVVSAAGGVAIAYFVGRGPVLITASVLFFAGAMRDIGLIPTTFVTLMLASAASNEFEWLPSAIWSAALTVFCAFLFHYALKLPLPLWPLRF